MKREVGCMMFSVTIITLLFQLLFFVHCLGWVFRPSSFFFLLFFTMAPSLSQVFDLKWFAK